MLCLYDALGDADADGDEWLHHSAFLGDAAARGLLAEQGAEPRRPRAVVAERARLVARMGALERARKDARLAPRKPAARGGGGGRGAPPRSPVRPRAPPAAPPGDRPASRPQPGAGRRQRDAAAPPRAAARLPKPAVGEGR